MVLIDVAESEKKKSKQMNYVCRGLGVFVLPAVALISFERAGTGSIAWSKLKNACILY